MISAFRRFWQDEHAATAVEYAFLAGLIALGMLAALRFLGSHISGEFNTISNRLS